MDLNFNLKSTESLNTKATPETLETDFYHSQSIIAPKNIKDHSRKTSQTSSRSQRKTSTSWSISSDSKPSKVDVKLRELFDEIKRETKEEFFNNQPEFKGDEQYEFSINPEVPRLVWCAYCKAESKTYVVYCNDSKTFYNSVAIFLMGGVFGCCLLPYASKSCKGQKTACCKCHHLISEV